MQSSNYSDFMNDESNPIDFNSLIQDEVSFSQSNYLISEEQDQDHSQLHQCPKKQNKKIMKDNKKRLQNRLASHKKPSKSNKRREKQKQKKDSDYKKNICGYITKKTIRQFTGDNYRNYVERLCSFYNVSYEAAVNHYLGKIERVTGPSHLNELLEITSNQVQNGQIIKVFTQFFIWFLKQRYIRHTMSEGKMDKIQAYLKYKNTQLLPLIYQLKSNQPKDIQNWSTVFQEEQQVLKS